MALEKVELRRQRPDDYHCDCAYCRRLLGELRRPDGSYYSRLDRRRYYSPDETAKVKEDAGRIAKTPLHLARWAVQEFTAPGDWVLDPTAGAGTTLVEALTHRRNAVGVEIQTVDLIMKNIRAALDKITGGDDGLKYAVVHGDARLLGQHLDELGSPGPFALVVNNPPYSGDRSQKGFGAKRYEYDPQRDNLAFLGESDEYFATIAKIYEECARRLRPGGRFVVGVKDQMRNRAPDLLHAKLADVLTKIDGLKFEGVALLRHYPSTLHLNTYQRRTGVRPPLYQTIVVFQKEGA